MHPFKATSTPMQLLADDLRKLHLATQASRFARLFALYFLAHLAVPGTWNWQLIGVLAATSAEAAFQQMAPQLPVLPVLLAVLNSSALHKYLNEVWGHASTSGQPQTQPGPAAATTPLTAPPAASPAAGTPQDTTNTPSADPAQKPQAIPKNPA